MAYMFEDYIPDKNPLFVAKFLKNQRYNLHKAVLVSLFFHFFLGLSLFLTSVSSGLDKPADKNESLFDVITKNRQTVTLPQDMKDGILANIIRYEDILKKIRIQDSSLNKEDLSQLTNDLIESIMALQKGYTSLAPPAFDFNEERFVDEMEATQLDSGTKIFRAPLAPGKNEIRFNVLDRDTSEAFNRLSERITAVKEDFIFSGQRVRIENLEEGFKIVPAGYFFRDSPYEEILALGADLFYVVTGFPSVYKKTERADKAEKNKKTAEIKLLDLSSLKVFLIEEISQIQTASISDEGIRRSGAEEIHINEEKISQILDDLMVLPELEQLGKFQSDYLDRADIESESLAKLTREFTRNNLSTMMFDISEITSAFDYLEEIYFNKELDHFFYNIWLTNPTSTIGVEFLLCIADHIRFERNGLDFLHRAYEEAKDFLSQKYQRTEMFNKKQKCFVIKEIYESLVSQLPDLGFYSMEQVLDHYVEIERGIYNLLLDLSEESKNIALFELGRLAWNDELHSDALELWKDIDDSYSTRSLADIRRILSLDFSLPQTIFAIDSSFNWYVEREQRDFISRLVQFKKWQNRYKRNE